MGEVKSGTVADISDEELLRRVVTQCRYRYGLSSGRHQRYLAVMDNFMLGSTYAAQLCRRFDLDPNEMVKR